MAKTFKDFMVECAAFEHSQERFEIMKECAELELARQYIENQEFMAENAGLFSKQAGLSFDEGYFSESVDENTLEVLTEKAKSKSIGLRGRIWKGVLRIWRTFTKFLGRITGKFDSDSRDASACARKLSKMTLDEEQSKKLISIVNESKGQNNAFEPHPTNQPYAKRLKLSSTDGSADFANAKLWVAAALSDSVVYANVNRSEKVGALPIPVLMDVIGCFKLGGVGKIAGAATNAAKEWARVQSKGFEIDVHPGALSKALTQAQEATKMLESMVASLEGQAHAIVAQGRATVSAAERHLDKAGEDAGPQVDKAREKLDQHRDELNTVDGAIEGGAAGLQAMITFSIGMTTAIYSGLHSFRGAALPKIKAWLDTLESSKS